MEGEVKGDGHGDGQGSFDGTSVPLRRWEDWERSRLRKLKREEKRRRDMERAFPSGYPSEREHLGIRGDIRSQYDGSDTLSVTSSEDDQWGPQIGPYNENGPQYPPPPTALHPPEDILRAADTIDSSDLEAMLERGFDDKPSTASKPPPGYRTQPSTPTSATRYQLADMPTKARLNAYIPVARSDSPSGITPPNSAPPPMTPVKATSMAVEGEWQTGRRGGGGQRGENYGPLGPLDPAARF